MCVLFSQIFGQEIYCASFLLSLHHVICRHASIALKYLEPRIHLFDISYLFVCFRLSEWWALQGTYPAAKAPVGCGTQEPEGLTRNIPQVPGGTEPTGEFSSALHSRHQERDCTKAENSVQLAHIGLCWMSNIVSVAERLSSTKLTRLQFIDNSAYDANDMHFPPLTGIGT